MPCGVLNSVSSYRCCSSVYQCTCKGPWNARLRPCMHCVGAQQSFQQQLPHRTFSFCSGCVLLPCHGHAQEAQITEAACFVVRPHSGLSPGAGMVSSFQQYASKVRRVASAERASDAYEQHPFAQECSSFNQVVEWKKCVSSPTTTAALNIVCLKCTARSSHSHT